MRRVKAEYHNVIGLYHQEITVFESIKNHKIPLLITTAHAHTHSGLFHRLGKFTEGVLFVFSFFVA